MTLRKGADNTTAMDRNKQYFVSNGKLFHN